MPPGVQLGDNWDSLHASCAGTARTLASMSSATSPRQCSRTASWSASAIVRCLPLLSDQQQHRYDVQPLYAPESAPLPQHTEHSARPRRHTDLRGRVAPREPGSQARPARQNAVFAPGSTGDGACCWLVLQHCIGVIVFACRPSRLGLIKHSDDMVSGWAKLGLASYTRGW